MTSKVLAIIIGWLPESAQGCKRTENLVLASSASLLGTGLGVGLTLIGVSLLGHHDLEVNISTGGVLVTGLTVIERKTRNMRCAAIDRGTNIKKLHSLIAKLTSPG